MMKVGCSPRTVAVAVLEQVLAVVLWKVQKMPVAYAAAQKLDVVVVAADDDEEEEQSRRPEGTNLPCHCRIPTTKRLLDLVWRQQQLLWETHCCWYWR